MEGVEFEEVSSINTSQVVLKNIIENKVKLLLAARKADQDLRL